MKGLPDVSLDGDGRNLTFVTSGALLCPGVLSNTTLPVHASVRSAFHVAAELGEKHEDLIFCLLRQLELLKDFIPLSDSLDLAYGNNL